MDKLISLQAAIDCLNNVSFDCSMDQEVVEEELLKLPSVQPEIIRCKDCKHWNPQLKTANGNGLGSCDFHDVSLVTSEGFCYWAEKRGEAE